MTKEEKIKEGGKIEKEPSIKKDVDSTAEQTIVEEEKKKHSWENC
ncbi:MAG: hypothetical protein ABIJ23_04375 [Candidatus Magasanikbacteria bacterium]